MWEGWEVHVHVHCGRKRRREGGEEEWGGEKKERRSNPICFNTESHPLLLSFSPLPLPSFSLTPHFHFFLLPFNLPPSLHSSLFSPLLSSTIYCPLASLLYPSLHPASDTSTQGVLYYVDNNATLNWLVNSGPHPPYIAMVEPEMFNRLVCLIREFT